MMLRPGPSRPLAESQWPDLHAVRLVYELVEIRTSEVVAALRCRLQPLEVVPTVRVAILVTPVKMGLNISVLMVGYLEGDCATETLMYQLSFKWWCGANMKHHVDLMKPSKYDAGRKELTPTRSAARADDVYHRQLVPSHP